jgi:DNA-binding SARP family transcriptional activator/tetratricopeptide (TPR) repeat protein
MAPEMDFSLLGPLVVRLDGIEIPVQRGKQRQLLAVLLLNAGRLVSLDDLVATLWDPVPPPSARQSLQNYVMRLRHTLGEAGRARISTQPRGYLIRADPGELDVSRFDALLKAARSAARDGSWDTAAERARAALTLWRGEPLADVESELLTSREVPRLAELRLQAQETALEAGLRLGRALEVIPELRLLVTDHPLREHLHQLLMLALYRDGRQAEALACYQHARQVLIDELGAEPGTGLRQLHQQILAADPVLAVAEPGWRTAADVAPAAPWELPGAVLHFVGRENELKELTGLLDRAGEQTPGTLLISAIGGTAGVGKTALAVHWAHQEAERFPDGQLYVNLRGYDPGQPMPAADALAGFLRALGMPGQDIPPEAEERAARYRSLLAGRRMLVVLDNAAEVEQVRLLLPGTPASVAVVTSRDPLAGLVARDGAQRLDLDLLPLGEAVGLLRALIGARVDADPGAAAALAAQCSRLPLALRVAAELAAARQTASLAELAGELAGQQRRLDLLDADGDPRTAVRAVFSWSYRHLDADAARAFWLLSLHPGADLDPYAAAALTGTTLERACQLLDQLSRAHLIQPTRPGRHGMHDLLRAYGRELAAAHEGKGERRAALTRLFDHYLHTAAAAMNTLFPVESGCRPQVPLTTTPTLPATDHPAAARAWLDGERANLIAAAVHSAAHGWPGHTVRLAATLFRYLDVGGHIPEAVTIHSHARSAAAQISDCAAEAEALTSLGVVNLRQGRFQQATGHLKQALRLCQQTGDRSGEARVLVDLGLVDLRQGRYEQGRGSLQLAVAVYRDVGDRSGEARALANLGIIERRLGRYRQASECLLQALAVCRATGDRLSQAPVLTNLGLVDLQLGRYQQAVGHHRQALALFRETGNQNGEAHALSNLGVAELRWRRYQQAAGHLRHALTLFRETSDCAGEAEALNGLGEALLAAGQPGQARTEHAAALALTSQTGDKHEQARAHNGLGHCYHAAGDPGQDLRHWQEALALYTYLGAPEADQVRAQLAADNHCHETPKPPSSGAAGLGVKSAMSSIAASRRRSPQP